ncbi:hypothetical protein K9M79_00810 [Candidatus Woesearchaeota archaeon]|nr:hypothetical protein [Candidatus Woesearchaeota archaeon]
MPKTTFQAHPVQGLTCFHHYKDAHNKIVAIDMLYTSLESLVTQTTIELGTNRTSVDINGKPADDFTRRKVADHVKYFNYYGNFHMNSKANYTSDIGLASSAAAFACIAGCMDKLLGLDYDEIQLSRAARAGSFSASSAVPGGVSLVQSRMFAYAEQVLAPDDLADLEIVIAVAPYQKNHHNFYTEADSSPNLKWASTQAQPTATRMINALKRGNIDDLAHYAEDHVMLNYLVLQTGRSHCLLWKPDSIKAMTIVRDSRSRGNPVFYSMNTGGNVFAYCFGESVSKEMQEAFGAENINYLVTCVGGSMKEVKEA